MPRSDSGSPPRRHREDRHAASSSKHRDERRADQDDRRRQRGEDDDDRRRERGKDRDSGHESHRHRDHDRSRRSRYSDDEDEEEDRRRRRRRTRSRSHSSDDRRHRHKEKRRHRETSAERAERKAAKRAARKAEALASTEDEQKQRAAAAEMLMYSVEDNPFHDANLDQKFKWGKKEEKERKMGLTPAEAARRDAERRREAQEEIAKLNAKRAEREKEQAEREEEEARMARLAESAAMSEWVAKEDDFHLEQSRRRAAIRIKEQRAKPIDLLAMNLKWADPQILEEKEGGKDDDEDYAGLEIDFDEPYNIFESLDLAETEELHQDVQMYLTLEKNEQNLDFWRSMIVVCDDKLSELREASSAAPPRIDPTVKAEMNTMLSSKSHDELLKLQEQVQAKLSSGEPVDVEYWESLLKSILVWRSKAKLRDMHEVVLSNRLEYLRRHQRNEAVVAAAAVEGASFDEEVDQERQAEADRATGMAAFLRAQEQKRKGGRSVEAKEEAMLREEMAKGMDGVEAAFKEEVDLGPSKVYEWDDKYRPRKPRYFNRVISGYEWNKYNQSHYDKGNPPPKVVQGYRFNIFYPDLVDKTTTPRYDIIREPGNDETVILKFSAGPPYEDLAFRLINRPWNMAPKRGFRSTFDRGVLTLSFNFSKMFYRR